MKQVIENCSICNEETLHDVGRKMATSKSKPYTRRVTSRCRQCGTRDINNSRNGRRVVKGYNQKTKQEDLKDGK